MVHMIDGGFEGEKKRKQSIIKLDLTFLTQANYCTIVYYKNYFQNNAHLFIYPCTVALQFLESAQW